MTGPTGMTGAVVEASDLAVGAVGQRAAVLAGVALAVAAGERVALVGGNGSGKTTLLRALAGIDRPLAGRVRWAGGRLPDGAARVRRVGVALQAELAPRFTVRELVTLGLALDRPPGPAERRAVDDALALAALHGLAGRPCTALSGGEAQRAVLARALVAGPELVLLDEPTNHLDPAGRAMIQSLIDRLHDRGVAAVIATHDLELAASCDRIALLSGGRIAALGRPADVLTPALLAATLGVEIRRLDDPDGGPPMFRILGPSHPAARRREVAA
jgi:iron complex transport system ATP-binding protein